MIRQSKVTIIQKFSGRQHGPLVQFIKYAIGGLVATMVHVCLFYCFALKLMPALNQRDMLAVILKLHVAPVSDVIRARNSVIDNGFAFVFSNLTAYLINIAWVFEPGRYNRVLEISFFYLVSGVSILIGSVLMGSLIDRFGVMTTIAFGANVFVAMLLNFVLRKYVIFKG